MPQMKAKKRQPAHFDVQHRSSVFQKTVTWKVTVTERGVTARRDCDGTQVSITWEKLIGQALFYGGGGEAKH